MASKNKQPAKKGIIGTADDITARKQVEQNLLFEKQFSGVFIDSLPGIFYILDENGDIVRWNINFERLLGYSVEELPGMNALKVIAEEDRELVAGKILETFSNGNANVEAYMLAKSGQKIPHHLTGALMIIGDKRYLLGEGTDITERKKTEEALKVSEAQYRLLVDHIKDQVVLMDLNFKPIYISPSVEKLLGYTLEELKQLPLDKQFTATSFQSAMEFFSIEMATAEADPAYLLRRPLELEVYCKDGSTLWMESMFSLVRDENGKPMSLLGVGRDITDRKQTEDALRESEARYSLLSEHMSDSVWMMDMNLKTTYLSPSAVKLSGYTAKELLELPLEKRITPESLNLAFKVFSEELSKVEADPNYNPVRMIDLENYRKDGTTVWAESKLSVIRDASGKPVAFLGAARDITDRRKAEEALRESEDKYRSLVENINDVFYTLDTQGNITYVSPVVERFTKYKVSDLIGKPFIPLIHPDDLPGLLDSFNRLVSGQLEPWEFRILDKDGRIIFVRTSSRPIYEDGKIVGITALMTDITERKQMEQKLEEMATHDFLTGLPNRVLLLDRFTIAAALAHRNKARLAVMSLDLDKFKSVNDTLGHDAGDQVLKTISMRLTGIIRASDTLARIGGDEFILVMLETDHMEDATVIAQKILDSFMEPLLIDGHQLHLSTSIGIAVYPVDGQDLETLTKKSDAAMYYSKGHGRNQFKFFSDGDVGIGEDHKSAT